MNTERSVFSPAHGYLMFSGQKVLRTIETLCTMDIIWDGHNLQKTARMKLPWDVSIPITNGQQREFQRRRAEWLKAGRRSEEEEDRSVRDAM